MSSSIKDAFSSSHNDVSIKSEVGVSWNALNAGGAASVNKQHSDEYSSSDSFSTMEIRGGNPSFHYGWDTKADWQEWVDSVQERPAVVQYKIDKLSMMVADSAKKEHLDNAVSDYIQKHAATWPNGDPTSYTLGWCDCKWVDPDDYLPSGDLHCTTDCYKASCKTLGEGYFMKSLGLTTIGGKDSMGLINNLNKNAYGDRGMECCKACYK